MYFDTFKKWMFFVTSNDIVSILYRYVVQKLLLTGKTRDY